MKNKTLDYYNQNVTTFIADTISVDLKDTQNKFINALPGDKICKFCPNGTPILKLAVHPF